MNNVAHNRFGWLAALAMAVGMGVLASSAVGEDPAFIGSKKCKMCHNQEYKSWEETKMAKALDVLKPNERAEKKTAAGLDPAKDYTTDEKCVKCHVVGFGKASGYAIPAAGDAKAAKEAEKLAHVGCENCHGPGGQYEAIHKDVMTKSRPYTADEMHAAGMTKISAETCTVCHNTDSPTHDPAKPFDYEKQKLEGVHKQFPLKFRKE
ncbi:MAG: hypothetical protein HOP29_12750 [Phycisphaerales bacterium]|nr:hypothetical protein [Phycisphaerales bacterium]